MNENIIAEIRDNFKKELDKIYESITILGRETTDKIIECGGTQEDIHEVVNDYIDRGILWIDEFLEAFKITEPELRELGEGV